MINNEHTLVGRLNTPYDVHAFALPFDPEWKERKYSVHPWARFAFKPAEEAGAASSSNSHRAATSTPALTLVLN